MLGPLNFASLIRQLEEAIKRFEPDSDIFRLYRAICNRFGTLKKAILDRLHFQNIRPFYNDETKILLHDEKDYHLFRKILQTIANLLVIKIKVVHEKTEIEVCSSTSKKLKLPEPIVLRFKEDEEEREESELDGILNSFSKVSIKTR